MFYLNKIAPQRFFLLTALTFGLLVIFITPPLQVPDEINHFYRAWQLSEGQFLPVKNDARVGGFIPKSVDSLTVFFKKIRFENHPNISADDILLKFKIPLNEKEKKFIDFPNTAMYNIVSYLPQTATIYICRKINLPPLYTYYISRVFTLFCWLTIIYLSISLIPQYKWLFVVLALLPMSIYIVGSNSADVVSNAAAFLFLSFVFHVIVKVKKLPVSYWFIFPFCAFIVASAKLVYAPMLLLVFIIPKDAFPNFKIKLLFASGIMLVTLLTLIFWSHISSEVYTPYEVYNHQYRNNLDLVNGSNMHHQIAYLKNNPFNIIDVFLKSFIWNAQSFSQSYIGRLGWFNIYLPVWFIIVSYTSIILSLLDHRNTYAFSKQQMLCIFLCIIATLMLIIFSQYLTWEKVASQRAYFLQGRYFTPVFPLLFIFIASFFKTRINLGNVPFIVTSIASCLITILTIYFWYY